MSASLASGKHTSTSQTSPSGSKEDLSATDDYHDSIGQTGEPVTVMPKMPLTVADGEKTRRQTSPAKLPIELVNKSRTQMTRVRLLRDAVRLLGRESPAFLLEELSVHVKIVEELYAVFSSEHAYLESRCSAAHMDHPYFANDIYFDGCRIYADYQLTAARLRTALKTAAGLAESTREDTHTASRLPNTELSKFSGECAQCARAFATWIRKNIGKSRSRSDSASTA